MIFTLTQNTPLRRALDTLIVALLFLAPSLGLLVYCTTFILWLLIEWCAEIAAERRSPITPVRAFGHGHME